MSDPGGFQGFEPPRLQILVRDEKRKKNAKKLFMSFFKFLFIRPPEIMSASPEQDS